MELLTARYRLRDFTAADRSAFIAYHADPRMGAPERPEALLDRFAAWAAERPRSNYQFAIVERQAPHGLLGCAGLRGAELGIELAPPHWGLYRCAIEVTHALLRFGFDRLGLPAIHGVTTAGNTRVARLARWFGAAVSADGEAVTWRLTAAGWRHSPRR